MSGDDRTKHEIARDIIENLGGNPENVKYFSEGGTVTREFYDFVNDELGSPSGYKDEWEATKHVSARMAIIQAGGDPFDEDIISSSGTVTKKGLLVLENALNG